MGGKQQTVNSLDQCASDIISIINSRGTILYQSPSIISITGYTIKETIGKQIFDFLHPDELREIKKLFYKITLKPGYIPPYKHHIQHRNGSWIYIETYGYNQIDDPLIQGIILISRIITKDKEENKIFSTKSIIGENLPDKNYIIIIRENRYIEYINKPFPDTTIDKILGTDILAWISPSDRSNFKEVFKTILKEAKSQRIKVKLSFKNNDHQAILLITPLRQEKNLFLILSIDVDDIVSAYRKLKQREDLLQDIIDGANNLIISISTDGTITTWNKTAEEITGYTSDKMIGKNIFKLDLLDNPSHMEEEIKNICPHYHAKLEIILKTINNSKHIIRGMISPIHHRSTDKIKGMIFSGYDVTYETNISSNMLLSGNGYIILSEINKYAMQIFKKLIETNYRGLIVTRGTPRYIQELHRNTTESILILSPYKILSNIPNLFNPDDIIHHIEKFILRYKKTVILIDRIDYLITYFSFRSVLKMLYEINSMISQKNCILLLRINPFLLKTEQHLLLREEFQIISSNTYDKPILCHEYLKILAYIAHKNPDDKTVAIKELYSYFTDIKDITYHLQFLEKQDYINIEKRKKYISLSKKGEKYLEYRRIL